MAFWATRVLEIVKKHDSGGLLWKRIKLTPTRKANAKKRLRRVWQIALGISEEEKHQLQEIGDEEKVLWAEVQKLRRTTTASGRQNIFPASYNFFKKARASKKHRQQVPRKESTVKNKEEPSTKMEVEDPNMDVLVFCCFKANYIPSSISFGRRNTRGLAFIPRAVQQGRPQKTPHQRCKLGNTA